MADKEETSQPQFVHYYNTNKTRKDKIFTTNNVRNALAIVGTIAIVQTLRRSKKPQEIIITHILKD